MNKPLVLLITGAGLFAAGYWAGTLRTGTGGSPGKAGPVSAGAAARAAQAGAPLEEGASSAKAARAFNAGHPFVKGQAKAWLLSLAASLKESGRDEIALVEIAQIFMTMDEESAVEVSGALHELEELVRSGNPAFTDIPDADEMVTGALMVTAFRLSQLNPAAALALLKRLPESAPDEAFKMVFARVARQDPAQAEAMLDTLDAKRRKDAMEGLLESMAAKDPVAALALADRHPHDVPEHALQEITERLTEKDPQRAVAMALRRLESGKGSDGLRQVLSAWRERDRGAAEAWVENHTGAGQWTARAWLVEQDAEDDPQASLTKFTALQKSGADAKELAQTANTIATNLSQKDLPAARDWAINLPPGPIREQAVSAMLAQWVEEDSSAASAWISALPAGTERDDSAAILANAIRGNDPASAFEWARNIQNEVHRNLVLDDVYSTWHHHDAEAAEAAAKALPPEIRQNLPGFKERK